MHTNETEIKLFKQTTKINLSTLDEMLASWRVIHDRCKFVTLNERENILGELESKLNSNIRVNKF
jgi:hypothetical protein